MKTVAQPAHAPHQAPAWPNVTAALDRIESAQRRALVAWHRGMGLGALDDAIAAQPHFPLIDCNDRARAFAPARSAPAPAGAA
jgi:hypothetical protein